MANGIVYVGGDDGYFRAFNATTGAVIWQSPNIFQIKKGGALANGVIYVGSDSGNLYAFDASTGATKWTATLGGMVRSNPAVAGGIVYVGADDGRLYAFNATTGALSWKTAVLGTSTPTIVRSSPAVTGGAVFVTTSEGVTAGTGSQLPNGHTYAFNATTGAQLWNHGLPDMSGASPAVANGVAYASTYGHNYFAYDVSTGNQLWNAGFDTFTGVTDGPAVVNGNLYFLSIDGYMYDYADLTPPAFIFDSAPAPETQSSSASFTWHPSETITGSYSCKLDGVAKTCSSASFSASGFAQGSHTFSVSGTDLSGNTGTSSFTWTVDTTPPDISIVKHPSAQTTSSSATFNLSTTDPTGTFLCQLDSQSQQPCSAWPVYTVPDGNHTFKAWTQDEAGNVSTTPAAYSWVSDTGVPKISVTGPTKVKYGSSPKWTLTADDPVTYYCSKDGGTYKLCPSPTTWTKPSVGTHTIKWYGIDTDVWIKSNIVKITLTVTN